MDRGRAGGYVGNNYVQEQLNKKKRQQHLDRINKIKSRKPGSSATLDNNPPVVIEAMLNDPRKSALRHHFNFVTERENKVLLKRISAILTAPPKITDKDYQEKKKLVIPKGKGSRSMYEKKMEEEKNKGYFRHLKAMKPYYKVKEWEADYQKQLFNQKFMRQVKYTRPPDFVDPLLPQPSESAADDSPAEEQKGGTAGDSSVASPSARGTFARADRKSASMITHKGGGGGRLLSLSTSSSHVSRVRAVRQDNACRTTSLTNLRARDTLSGHSTGGPRSSSRGCNNGLPNISRGDKSGGGGTEEQPEEEDEYGYGFDDFDNPEEGSGSNIRVNVYEGGGGEYDHDSFYEGGAGDCEDDHGADSGGAQHDENRVQLAVVHRSMRVADESGADPMFTVGFSASQTNNSSLAMSSAATATTEADVQCWLINRQFLVLSATVLGNAALDAEAEISVADLSVIRGLPSEAALLGDMSALEAVAREMAENVELRVDSDRASRLVLNLVSDGDDEAETDYLSDSESAALTGARGMELGSASMSSPAPHTENASVAAAAPGASLSVVSEAEIEGMLLTDHNQMVLRKGARLPVAFNVNANAQSIGSITALIELAKRAKRIEHVYALLTLSSTSDDQMCVVAHFVTSTTFMFKRGSKHRAAVLAGTSACATTSLPSVIQADPDMLQTFAENLARSLKVEHDCKTGENELIILGS